MPTKKETVKKMPITKKIVTKKVENKKSTPKKEVPVKKSVAKKNEPVKAKSRRLTNKERNAIFSILMKHISAPKFDGSSEVGKLLISALEKIKVK
jgi:hypothetical protein